jgi:AcrR family transcriptional regulator
VSRREEVVNAAERILEDEGPDAVTMRRLAAALGVRAPSLYKHVKGKPEILAALQERALDRIAVALGAAADQAPTGGELPAMAGAYRAWARAHPRLYELSTRHPLDRGRLSPGVEEAAAAPLLRVTGGRLPVARALWGLAHGLVDLELAGRFPPDADVDAAWAYAIGALRTASGSA